MAAVEMSQRVLSDDDRLEILAAAGEMRCAVGLRTDAKERGDDRPARDVVEQAANELEAKTMGVPVEHVAHKERGLDLITDELEPVVEAYQAALARNGSVADAVELRAKWERDRAASEAWFERAEDLLGVIPAAVEPAGHDRIRLDGITPVQRDILVRRIDNAIEARTDTSAHAAREVVAQFGPLLRVLDQLGWSETGNRETYALTADRAALVDFLRGERDACVENIEYQQKGLERQRQGDADYFNVGSSQEESIAETEQLIESERQELATYTGLLAQVAGEVA